MRATAAFCGACGSARSEAPRSATLAPRRAFAIAATGYVLVLLSNILDLGASFHGWAGLGYTEILLFVATLAGTWAIGRSARAWLSWPRITLRGVAATLGGLVLALLAAEALARVLTMHDATLVDEFRDDGGLPAALLSIAVLTPVLEESFFRGVILECAQTLFSTRAAVIVTALLFSVLHLTPATVIHHGLLGYVCGRARVGSGSLWPAIACHALYNAVVVLMAW